MQMGVFVLLTPPAKLYSHRRFLVAFTPHTPPALHDFKATAADELSFSKGDTLKVRFSVQCWHTLCVCMFVCDREGGVNE